jgi:hypothetical protein
MMFHLRETIERFYRDIESGKGLTLDEQKKLVEFYDSRTPKLVPEFAGHLITQEAKEAYGTDLKNAVITFNVLTDMSDDGASYERRTSQAQPLAILVKSGDILVEGLEARHMERREKALSKLAGVFEFLVGTEEIRFGCLIGCISLSLATTGLHRSEALIVHVYPNYFTNVDRINERLGFEAFCKEGAVPAEWPDKCIAYEMVEEVK